MLRILYMYKYIQIIDSNIARIIIHKPLWRGNAILSKLSLSLQRAIIVYIVQVRREI